MKTAIVFMSGVAVAAAMLISTAYTGGLGSDSAREWVGMQTPDTDPKIAQGDQVQRVRVPEIPSAIDLAGEPLPTDNFDALERFDRELLSICFSHAVTINNIKLANRIFPVIEPILKQNGIPDDFKYLAVTESNLRNAISPAGARGIWQFMPETAKEYGMDVNDEIDERLHLEKSTEAACRYLLKSYKDFQSWTLAAASYNMGGGRLKGHIDSQKHESYYDLFMNNETSRYVPRILAHKYVMLNPERYGFFIDKKEVYPTFPIYKTVTITGAVPSWSDFAREQGITYRALKVHNPWIVSDKLTNKAKKMYVVKIPQGEK